MEKTVLITGASGHLGKDVVDRFVKEGYHVAAVVSSRRKRSPEFHESVAVFEADLTNEQEARDLVSRVLGQFGTLDAALFLAGGFAPGKLTETDLTAVRKMLSTNFETAFTVATAVYNHMMERKSGRIIFVGARPALRASDGKNLAAYALSKSLLFKLAELMNAGASGSNVVASVVVPSTIDTEANREAMPDADFSKWVTPGEIAAEMAFLCSSESRSLREPVLKLYGNS